MVEAGKTGCAWCVVWDELVDDILREVGGVYLDRQGPQMLRLTQAPPSPAPLPFSVSLSSLEGLRTHFSPSPVLSHLPLSS